MHRSWQNAGMTSGHDSAALPAAGDESRASLKQPSREIVLIWRRVMLERVLWAEWGTLALAVVFMLPRALQTGQWTVLAMMTGAWMVVGLSAWQRQLDLRVRGLGLYLGMVTACIGAVSFGGVRAPNAFLGLMMVVVLLALGLGTRAALMALAASVVALGVMAALFTSGYTVPDPGMVNPLEAGNWIRVIATFAAVTGATVVCVAFLISKLESAMLGGQALLDALARENAQRLEALERERALFAQLQQAQKLESVGTLAGGVAHDFNNLLLVILSHAEGMRRRLPGDAQELADSVTAIEGSARRAAELTRQLLAFSRQQVADRDVFELNATTEHSLTLIRRLLPASIELRVERAGEPIAVWGAPYELDQILMNLCVNARDAMPNGGSLEVSTALSPRRGADGVEKPHACIRVRDDGVGMTPEQRARIFDPFFTTKGPDRGTGLGLSVVHGIVAQWGGSIEVESTLGEGTTMSVFLPLSVERMSAAARVATAGGALRGDETVLLADDEPRVRQVVESMLSDAGYRVISCGDGLEALDRFRAAPDAIDILITDAVMPRMGGRELYEALAVDRPALPCLICSGYTAETVTPDFLLPGRREFLQKPFASDELLGRTRALLDAASHERPSRAPRAEVLRSHAP